LRKIDPLDLAANYDIPFAPQHNCERNASYAINIFSFAYTPVSNIALSIFDNDKRTCMYLTYLSQRAFHFLLLTSLHCNYVICLSHLIVCELLLATTFWLAYLLEYTFRNINFNYKKKLLISIVKNVKNICALFNFVLALLEVKFVYHYLLLFFYKLIIS